MRKATLNCPAVARRKFLRQVLRRLLKYSYIANPLFKMGSDSTNNFDRFSLVKSLFGGADDGIRTHTELLALTNFKSVASAISPHRRCAAHCKLVMRSAKTNFALADLH